MSARNATHAKTISSESAARVLLAQAQKNEQHLTLQRLGACLLLLVCATLGMLTSLLFMASDDQPAAMGETLHRMPMPAPLPSHILVLGGSVGAGIVIGVLIVLALNTMHAIHSIMRPRRTDTFIPLTPFTLDLPAEEVTFTSQQGNRQGIYIARPAATTTILVSPGYRRSYRDMLGLCKHLWAAGHNVLAFDYAGHGVGIGALPFMPGCHAVDDFLGAVAYAKMRAPGSRIGALGYGMGGAISIMGSARTTDVHALVTDSAFASACSPGEMALRQALHLPANSVTRVAMNILYRVTDFVLARRTGQHFQQVEPWREIARFAPRPVLLIHGMSDTVVPPSDSVRLYEAAGASKALWLIPETAHMAGYMTDSAKYVDRVIDFFEHALKESFPESSPVHRQAWTAHDRQPGTGKGVKRKRLKRGYVAKERMYI